MLLKFPKTTATFSFDHPESEYSVRQTVEGWQMAESFWMKGIKFKKLIRKWKAEMEKEMECDKVKWSKNI